MIVFKHNEIMKQHIFVYANSLLQWRVGFLVLLLALVWPVHRAEASYIFEYTGTVFFTGGSVNDGTILPYHVGDHVAGSFTYNPGSPDIRPDPQEALFMNSIGEINFDGFSSNGALPNHAFFQLNSANGTVQANVSEDDGINDNVFAFVLFAGNGLSPFSDVTFDLTQLALTDFSAQQSYFLFWRLSNDLNPQRHTLAEVRFDSLSVRDTSIQILEPATLIPEPPALALTGIALVGFVLTRRCRQGCLNGITRLFINVRKRCLYLPLFGYLSVA